MSNGVKTVDVIISSGVEIILNNRLALKIFSVE